DGEENEQPTQWRSPYGRGDGVRPRGVVGGPLGVFRGDGAGVLLVCGGEFEVAAAVGAELKNGSGRRKGAAVGVAPRGAPSRGAAGATTCCSGPTNDGSSGPPSFDRMPATTMARLATRTTAAPFAARRVIRRRAKAPR